MAVKVIVVILLGVGVLYGVYHFRSTRLLPSQRKEIELTRQRLNQIDTAQAQAATAEESTVPTREESVPVNDRVARPIVDEDELVAKQRAPMEFQIPEVFHVKFETSKGDFIAEFTRTWAPLGVDRVYKLVQRDFFTDVTFFRVVTEPRPFVVQFGISGYPKVSAFWRSKNLHDDPVRETNRRGTITYAMAGPGSRTAQLFINLGDNEGLDAQGFAPIGQVVQGMEVIDSFNGQYGDKPTAQQTGIQREGNAYLDRAFPGLDFIIKAEVVDYVPAEAVVENAPAEEAVAPEAEPEASTDESS
jgi:cyclophilin family peptidyl-prolyl cis-trans isomerase